MRGIDAKKSTKDELYHPYDKAEDLVPGKIYEMKLSMPPLGHVLRQGHVLELSILAPAPIPQPDWGPLPLDLPGRNSVYQSAQYPSALTLPVISGLKAQAPPPECGSTQFQPCRMGPKPTVLTSSR
jgi:hypothetical protein